MINDVIIFREQMRLLLHFQLLDGEIPDTYVIISNKDTKELQRVSLMDPNVEPWIYPLFYPHGSRGWHKDMYRKDSKSRVS